MQSQSVIHISDIEAAINYWRLQLSEIADVSLSDPIRFLAYCYGFMIYEQCDTIAEQQLAPQARQAWYAWYATTPDTPCIAICSTSQGDAICKGCGRTAEEVQNWLIYSPIQKRMVWRRITQQARALRFTCYTERAIG